MKRFSFALLTFALLLGFTQCGKDPIDEPEQNDNQSEIVTITFELPVENKYRTDFSEFLVDGETQSATINWNKTGYETVYLAIPNKYNQIWDDEEEEYVITLAKECAQLIPLRAVCDGGSKLVFEGGVDAKDLMDGTVYTLYYMGNEGSSHLAKTYDATGAKLTKVVMDLNNQNGTRTSLGDLHFATLAVKAQGVKDSNNKTIGYNLNALNNNVNFTAGIAISLFDLEGVSALQGNAVVNNAISIEYNEDVRSYEIDYISLGNGGISLNGTSSESFVAMVPNTQANATVECSKGRYIFENGVLSNNVYYNYNTKTHKVEPLKWITE